MRLDKFLKVTFLIKRRSVAKETADEGVIYINGKVVKPSYDIKIGDIIEIDMYNSYKKIEVLSIPTGNSIPKPDVEKYIQVQEYKTK